MSVSVVSDILGESIELFVRDKKIILSLTEAKEILDVLGYTVNEIDRCVDQPQILYDNVRRPH